MTETATQTIFVIKNNNGQFLELQKYNGLRTWTDVFSDRCAFTSQNAATLYCRNLIADARIHGIEIELDVYKHTNQIIKLNVDIPENQLKNYGVPESADTD